MTGERPQPLPEIASVAPAVLNSLPAAVMLCDRRTFAIAYANRKSVEIVRELKPWLPDHVDPDNLVGTNIDTFHKNPAHQRRLLADDSNLPHSTIFRIGTEFIELTVDTVGADSDMLSVCWAIVTKREMLQQMVQTMPLNTMLADPETLKLTFINETSKSTLKRVEHLLPVKVDEMEGQCIDIFHKHPEGPRRILSNPDNLPHHAVIRLGDEYLDLNVAAIRDRHGSYIAPMLNWSISTENVLMARDVRDVTAIVQDGSVEMKTEAEKMVNHTGNGANRTLAITEHTQQTQDLFNSVSAATEELTSSVGELRDSIRRSEEIAGDATNQADTLNDRVGRLEQAAKEIGGIVKLIDDIAGKTNMLALNATIEAARAGEAGRGFSVVANEVKALAKQTSDSTARIAQAINEIRTEVTRSSEDIGRIVEVIRTLNETTQETRHAAEQQSVATQEISNVIHQGSEAMENVAKNVAGLLDQNVNVIASAIRVLWKTEDMLAPSAALREKVGHFLKDSGM
ncbi:methyl-accepting chemotaxis protein [Kordiimonas marina]|uniref:methyl-accepting chemotaxis protein n=1 Tax=Kordiimonas marina TaxID=2872312 RepID=UPI001FF555EE|nr:methyl-accepting chemotaxis protein [Kordiimonas marina]MCJ9427917.1 hypothetical protein [Kordiimonas marina]